MKNVQMPSNFRSRIASHVNMQRALQKYRFKSDATQRLIRPRINRRVELNID